MSRNELWLVHRRVNEFSTKMIATLCVTKDDRLDTKPLALLDRKKGLCFSVCTFLAWESFIHALASFSFFFLALAIEQDRHQT